MSETQQSIPCMECSDRNPLPMSFVSVFCTICKKLERNTFFLKKLITCFETVIVSGVHCKLQAISETEPRATMYMLRTFHPMFHCICMYVDVWFASVRPK